MAKRGWLDAFIDRRRLPASFRDDAEAHLGPVVSWLAGGAFTTIGLSGAQGTGKTTVGTFVVEALKRNFGRRAVLLSLDDFYLPQRERQALADRVHPLLATRGVPGTHDLPRLHATLDALRAPAGSLPIPAFDKARDDRLSEAGWPRVELPVDLVVLEGWCVGITAEAREALETPVNSLERDQDPDGTWRRFVNGQLEDNYARLNARLDALVYLEAPDMASVIRWRTRQERELRQDRGGGMPEAGVADFVRYFERLTRHGLETLPTSADVVVTLDDSHGVAGVRFNRGGIRES